MDGEPSLIDQRSFWDEWNASHRAQGVDAFMARQAAEASREARSLAARTGSRRLRILEVGCGTGWLASALTRYGEVTATDLSERSVAIGRSRYPDVRFIAGDFAAVDLGPPYDLVVSADTIAHVADQGRLVDRFAQSLVTAGVLVLMTQNAFVWRRSSYLSAQGRGQLRDWPTLGRLRQMLAPRFSIVRIGSIVPGGDRGVLRMTHWIGRGSGAVGLGPLVQPILERGRIGRELVIACQRR